jgi:hypothetical protein
VAAPLVPPDLGSSTEPSPTVNLVTDAPLEPVPSPVSRIPIPLAAGIGGVAGLLTLAWRHGTLRRAVNEIQHATGRAGGEAHDGGDEEDESYTSAA